MGSIRKRPDRAKPYQARYWGPDQRQHSKSFRRRTDAKRWLTAEEGSADRGEWTDPRSGRMPFADYAQTWLAERTPTLKPSSRAGYERLLRLKVIPTFGDRPLNQIGVPDVRAWQTDMLGTASAAWTSQARKVLSQILTQAVDDGLIVSNPVSRVRAPKTHPRRQLFLTAFQLKALADAADTVQEGAGALVWFLGWSGLRWGEATALAVGGVDPKRRRVSVEWAFSDVAGTQSRDRPKTGETRTVIVPAFVIDRIRPHLNGKDPDELVFTGPRGGQRSRSNFQPLYKRAVKEAGLDASLVVHDLRDTAASLMVSTGASVKAVQRALGHKSAAMTLDVYASLFTEDLEDLADRMEARWGNL